jgi:hypothetical protein
VATEITYIVEYPCPHCGALLEARSSQIYGWLRCPRCGRAGLPPEHMRVPRNPAREPLGDDVLIIGPEPADKRKSAARGPGGVRRMTSASALFLSLLIVLLALLEQDRITAGLFTLVALVCLVVSLVPVSGTKTGAGGQG